MVISTSFVFSVGKMSLSDAVFTSLLILHGYFFRRVINFSIMLNKQLSSPRRGPIVLNISRRLFMSVLLMVRVSIATIKKVKTKKTMPIVNSIKLLKCNWFMRTYVRIAVVADERIIFAEKDQSMVKP